MLREIGDSVWMIAKDYLRLHPEKTYAIAKGRPYTLLEDELKLDWCYVVERKGNRFEQVTYYQGVEKCRR